MWTPVHRRMEVSAEMEADVDEAAEDPEVGESSEDTPPVLCADATLP